MTPLESSLNRRRVLALLGAAGATTLANISSADAAEVACIEEAPEMTEGPYWVDEKLNRSDIRVDPTDGSVRPGVQLDLTVTVQNQNGSTCTPLAGAYVDIWHCDAEGTYSDESVQNTQGQKFLRGYQITGDSGTVNFTTIYPGWYSGRTVHIHMRIRTYSGSSVLSDWTTQLFFDDNVTTQVYTQSPYSSRPNRDTLNSTDSIYGGASNGSVMLVNLTQTASGYAGTITVGVTLNTPAAATPVISANGVVSAASYQVGVTPGAWTSIFGQDLAATTHTLDTTDLVDGNLPTTLSGVSVDIGGTAAYVHYVSPTQVNVQAPASSTLGSVEVSLTNSAGSSAAVSVNQTEMLPAFFTFDGGYVAAVKLDGTIVTGSASSGDGTVAAATLGEVLELYGTGFGPTDPSVPPGEVTQTAAPLTNDITLSIGSVNAEVLFAGLSGAGLYQFNVTVPASLANGDHEVVASIAGLTSQSNVLLKVQAA